MADLGFGGIVSSGLSRVDATVIYEALSGGCVGTTAMLSIHNMCGGLVDKFGTEAQRDEYLSKLSSLELKASYCLTEPDSGISVHKYIYMFIHVCIYVYTFVYICVYIHMRICLS
jgi:alkylation response protein AidB-like acyl-CoA dehydrogenase